MIDREQMDNWDEAPERIWATGSLPRGYVFHSLPDAGGIPYIRTDTHEAAIREAVEAERRRCAEIAGGYADEVLARLPEEGFGKTAGELVMAACRHIAAAIRGDGA